MIKKTPARVHRVRSGSTIRSLSSPPQEREIVQRTIEQLEVPEKTASRQPGQVLGERATARSRWKSIQRKRLVPTRGKALKEVEGLSRSRNFQGPIRRRRRFSPTPPPRPRGAPSDQAVIDKLAAGGFGSLRVVVAQPRTPAAQGRRHDQGVMVGKSEGGIARAFFDIR